MSNPTLNALSSDRTLTRLGLVVVVLGGLLSAREACAVQVVAGKASPASNDPESSWDVAQAAASQVQPGASFVPGQVLVGLSSEAAHGSFVSEANSLGYGVLGEIPRLRVLKVSCAPGHEALAIARLRAVPGVAFAERNAIGKMCGIKQLDDPCVPDQWQWKNDGSNEGVVGADIDLDGAWAITRGSEAITVAILDTGIEFDVPEFVGRLLPGYDFVDEDPDPTSVLTHGIFVAGLIGGRCDNGYAGTGIDQACRMLPLRVLDDAGQGNVFDVSQAIDYAVNAGANVINMSLGFNLDFMEQEQQTFEAALQEAHDTGCILVAGAGNDGGGAADHIWPSASPLTISVGSTNNKDVKGNGSGTGSKLDFMAPGGGGGFSPGDFVVSCMPLEWGSPCDRWNGTSFACATVSGVVSLLLSVRPDLSQAEVYALLAAGAKDQIGPPEDDLPGWDKKYGYGRISAGASLRALNRLLATPGSLGIPDHLTSAKGGHQLMLTRVDPSLRGSPWITLGSVTGTAPGTQIGHVHIPLNSDHYFLKTSVATGGLLHPAFGVVPDDGVILQSVDVPADWASGLGVQQLEHCLVVVHDPPMVMTTVRLAIEP